MRGSRANVHFFFDNWNKTIIGFSGIFEIHPQFFLRAEHFAAARKRVCTSAARAWASKRMNVAASGARLPPMLVFQTMQTIKIGFQIFHFFQKNPASWFGYTRCTGSSSLSWQVIVFGRQWLFILSLWEKYGFSFWFRGKEIFIIVVRPDNILLFKGNHLSLWEKFGSISFRIALRGFISSGCAAQSFFTPLNDTSKMFYALLVNIGSKFQKHKTMPLPVTRGLRVIQGALEPAYLA